MNIAIVNTRELLGGAARAANRLCKGLRTIGQQPAMIVRSRDTAHPCVCRVDVKSSSFFSEQEVSRAAQYLTIDAKRSERSNTLFCLPYPGIDLSTLEPIRQADIINLHWLAQFQSVESIALLLALGKPVVWTMHDENAYTGGCHFTAGCTGFQAGCKECPQLTDNPYLLPAHILESKLREWLPFQKNLSIVTPSSWLAQRVRTSKLFQEANVEVIPNSLETDVFRPLDKREARSALKLNQEALYLLFNTPPHMERRKGFPELLKTLRLCLKNDTFKQMALNGKIQLLIVGISRPKSIKLGIPTRAFGYVHSDRQLAQLYSAADLFILPSLEDNLPNTMLEAMACATPVVGFSTGGIPEMVRDGETGYVVPSLDCERMAEVILDLVFSPQKRAQMGRNCRRLIEERYKLEDQAAAYMKLFKRLSPREGERHVYEQTVKKNKKIVVKEWTSRFPPELSLLYRDSIAYLRTLKRADNLLGKRLGKAGSRSVLARMAGNFKARCHNLYNYKSGRLVMAMLTFAWRTFRKIPALFRSQGKLRRV